MSPLWGQIPTSWRCPRPHATVTGTGAGTSRQRQLQPEAAEQKKPSEKRKKKDLVSIFPLPHGATGVSGSDCPLGH